MSTLKVTSSLFVPFRRRIVATPLERWPPFKRTSILGTRNYFVYTDKFPKKMTGPKSNSVRGEMEVATKVPGWDNIIWVDLEMTGLDPDNDLIMEIGLIVTDGQCNEIARQDSIIINVPDHKLQGMDAWCTQTHGDSGLTQQCKQSTITTDQAEDQVLEFLKKYTPEKLNPMGGNSIATDRVFLMKHMPKLYSYFHYRIIDVSSIKELVKRWYPITEIEKIPKKRFGHRSIEDLEDSIRELRYYRANFFRSISNIEEQQQVKSTTQK